MLFGCIVTSLASWLVSVVHFKKLCVLINVFRQGECFSFFLDVCRPVSGGASFLSYHILSYSLSMFVFTVLCLSVNLLPVQILEHMENK